MARSRSEAATIALESGDLPAHRGFVLGVLLAAGILMIDGRLGWFDWLPWRRNRREHGNGGEDRNRTEYGNGGERRDHGEPGDRPDG